MSNPVTRDELLMLIQESWEEWDTLIRTVPEKRMEEPTLDGWSVKDVIAHVAWGEREMVKLLTTRSMANASELWELPLDARNQAMVEQSHTRTLDEVLAEHTATHEQMVAQLEKVEEAALHDPSYFTGMPSDWSLFILIKGNTYLHYPEHVAMVSDWRASQ